MTSPSSPHDLTQEPSRKSSSGSSRHFPVSSSASTDRSCLEEAEEEGDAEGSLDPLKVPAPSTSSFSMTGGSGPLFLLQSSSLKPSPPTPATSSTTSDRFLSVDLKFFFGKGTYSLPYLYDAVEEDDAYDFRVRATFTDDKLRIERVHKETNEVMRVGEEDGRSFAPILLMINKRELDSAAKSISAPKGVNGPRDVTLRLRRCLAPSDRAVLNEFVLRYETTAREDRESLHEKLMSRLLLIGVREVNDGDALLESSRKFYQNAILNAVGGGGVETKEKRKKNSVFDLPTFIPEWNDTGSARIHGTSSSSSSTSTVSRRTPLSLANVVSSTTTSEKYTPLQTYSKTRSSINSSYTANKTTTTTTMLQLSGKTGGNRSTTTRSGKKAEVHEIEEITSTEDVEEEEEEEESDADAVDFEEDDEEEESKSKKKKAKAKQKSKKRKSPAGASSRRSTRKSDVSPAAKAPNTRARKKTKTTEEASAGTLKITDMMVNNPKRRKSAPDEEVDLSRDEDVLGGDGGEVGEEELFRTVRLDKGRVPSASPAAGGIVTVEESDDDEKEDVEEEEEEEEEVTVVGRSSSSTATAVGSKIAGTTVSIPEPPLNRKQVLFTYPPDQSLDSITVTVGDRERLKPGTFLNDSLVDFYCKYLKEETTTKHSAVALHVFSSFFFTKLRDFLQGLEGGAEARAELWGSPDSRAATRRYLMYTEVENWSLEYDIFRCQCLLFPINKGMHWSLACVLFNRDASEEFDTAVMRVESGREGEEKKQEELGQIIMLDSMSKVSSHDADEIADALRLYLNHDLEARKKNHPSRVGRLEALRKAKERNDKRRENVGDAKTEEETEDDEDDDDGEVAVLDTKDAQLLSKSAAELASQRAFELPPLERCVFNRDSLPVTCLDCPQQEDSVNCGIYVLNNVEHVMRLISSNAGAVMIREYFEKQQFSSSNADGFRRKIQAVIDAIVDNKVKKVPSPPLSETPSLEL